ncbi:hypothetical protein WMF01_38110 [Sorangium sp. So ce1667]
MPTFHAWLGAARRGAAAARAGAVRAAGLALPVAIVVAAIVAYDARFLQDDAYISFRYAKHLASGHGLVFNVGGPRVEGYTNFLFTVLVAAGMALGSSAEHAALGIGLAAHVGTLIVVPRTARALGASRTATVAALVTLGLNPTFAAYATGGLETSLAALLAILAVTRAVAAPDGGRERAFAGVSALFGLATMTRPDAGVPIVAAVAVVLLARRPSAREVAALALPAALLIGAHAGWKLHYYGSLVPNPFHAKRIADAPLAFGARYVGAFLWTNGLAAAFVLAALAARRLGADRSIRALAAALLAVVGFVAWAGGDFMEYRLLVPAMPVGAILLSRTAFSASAPLAIATFAVLAGASAARASRVPGFEPPLGVTTTAALRAHVLDPDVGWLRVGAALGDAFDHDPSISMAVRPAGAIPFASDLTTIDMLGLNDAWIARHGIPVRYPEVPGGYRPGHAVTAPLDYLARSGVNLIVAHPVVVPEEAPSPAAILAENRYFAALGFTAGSARVIVVPLGNGLALLAWYLTPSAQVDAVIARRGLRVAGSR